MTRASYEHAIVRNPIFFWTLHSVVTKDGCASAPDEDIQDLVAW